MDYVSFRVYMRDYEPVRLVLNIPLNVRASLF